MNNPQNMFRVSASVLLLMFSVVLGVSACTQQSASAKSNPPPGKAVPIEGTKLKRLILQPEAAKRVDLQTAAVREEQVMRKRKVGGDIISLPIAAKTGAGFAPATLYVRVRLSENELKQVDQSQAAIIEPLVGEVGVPGLTAQPVNAPDLGEAADEIPALYYFVVGGAQYGLSEGQRIFVQLPITGTGATRKIVPYEAVLYDPNGGTWVYQSVEPLVFVRHPITVEYVLDGQAILLDGPPAGTQVATIGAAELFGLEFGAGK